MVDILSRLAKKCYRCMAFSDLLISVTHWQCLHDDPYDPVIHRSVLLIFECIALGVRLLGIFLFRAYWQRKSVTE